MNGVGLTPVPLRARIEKVGISGCGTFSPPALALRAPAHRDQPVTAEPAGGDRYALGGASSVDPATHPHRIFALLQNCARHVDALPCYGFACPRPWLAALRRKYNVIQLGNHAAIPVHNIHMFGINGPMVSAPSIAQLSIPTRTAHIPAYLHVQYHTTGKTHIVLTNKTKAMRDSLSSGNISRAI